ncbi:response regulator, partial [Escherichia coli]|nr:response regulator [Escherichia coli]
SDGLGLGLSIVERIAALLGMSIGVSSRVGKGSVFSVRMPVCSDAVLPVIKNPAASEPNRALDGLRVLCIDDDERSLAGMKELLQTWGCAVEVLTNGKGLEALCQNLGEPPDMILADYNLEDENGIDL